MCRTGSAVFDMADDGSGAPRSNAVGPIEGVVIYRLERNYDRRGSFVDIFRSHWGYGIDPQQWSIVHSQPRTLRGMHLHWRHEELFTLIKGRATVGLYDIRQNSPSFRCSQLLEFAEERCEVLVFPRGILHGWYFHCDSLHLQSVSESYDTYGPDDNQGCRWNDPALQLAWPDPDPILSDRAAAFPDLTELLTQSSP